MGSFGAVGAGTEEAGPRGLALNPVGEARCVSRMSKLSVVPGALQARRTSARAAHDEGYMLARCSGRSSPGRKGFRQWLNRNGDPVCRREGRRSASLDRKAACRGAAETRADEL